MSERTLKDALNRAKSLRDFQVNSPERFEKCPDFQDIVTLANELQRRMLLEISAGDPVADVVSQDWFSNYLEGSR